MCTIFYVWKHFWVAQVPVVPPRLFLCRIWSRRSPFFCSLLLPQSLSSVWTLIGCTFFSSKHRQFSIIDATSSFHQFHRCQTSFSICFFQSITFEFKFLWETKKTVHAQKDICKLSETPNFRIYVYITVVTF